MQRLRLVEWVILLMLAGVLVRTVIPPEPPAMVQAAPERRTRGPIERVDTVWQELLIQSNREQQLSMGALILQAGTLPVRIDGSIPLWGVIIVIVSGIITGVVWGITLRTRQDSHEAIDVLRFAAHAAQITALSTQMAANHAELRQDIARIRG